MAWEKIRKDTKKGLRKIPEKPGKVRKGGAGKKLGRVFSPGILTSWGLHPPFPKKSPGTMGTFSAPVAPWGGDLPGEGKNGVLASGEKFFGGGERAPFFKKNISVVLIPPVPCLSFHSAPLPTTLLRHFDSLDRGQTPQQLSPSRRSRIGL